MTGMRKTWQRDAVRTALDEADGFVSAQALHAAMRTGERPIGLATVYRALADLTADGEVDHLQQGNESLYRACRSDGHHHHLICRNCGRTVEIDAEPVEEWARRTAAAHGYTAPEHIVDIFGLCPECSAA
jgi:Fur family ferric uptake transcriptional regulator